MSRYKGAMTKAAIDRGWPHQVMLSAEQHRKDFVAINTFGAGLSLCARGHTFMRNDHYRNVFCFAVEADADVFRERFNGERIDPKKRPKWPGR